MKEPFTVNDVRPSNLLRDQFGEEVILFNDQEQSNRYRILHEFTLHRQSYAVMQSERPYGDEDYEIFRINSSDGGIEIETIEDDEEWENIAEIYDEIVFGSDEDL